jgi:hypothetical protein
MGEDINNLGSELWVLGAGEKILTAKSAKKAQRPQSISN